MILGPDFRFSQSKLSAYASCPQLFYLRYIKELDWPALVSEPVLEREQHFENGSRFHLLVQQYVAGIPKQDITQTIHDDKLMAWWNSFMQFNPVHELTGRQLAEYTLSTRVAGFALDAKFDLLVVHPDDSFTIFDWKTNQRLPSYAKLEKNFQTRVYRYVVAKAGDILIEPHETLPENIKITYWFVEFPEESVEIQYSPHAMQDDEQALSRIIHEINSLLDDSFSKTESLQMCELCQYRSYCDRGVSAGSWSQENAESEETEDLLNSLNFDDIGEIAF